MSKKAFRIEHDSMGELQVPEDALWGAQTQRAVNNFPISGLPMPRQFIAALGLVKWAAAGANAELGLIKSDVAIAIQKASLAVAEGDYDEHFPIDVFQTGSGTSSNMNANEVISHVATEAFGSAWQTVLNDRITDLTSEVNHRFRGTIRSTTRELEERIENLKTGEEWDELARELQTVVAAAITDAFTDAEAGRVRIRAQLATMLAADDVVGTKAERAVDGIDLGALWRSRGLDPDESDGGKAFRTGLTGLRGAQSGVLMLGMTSQFLPQAAGLFIASNPVLLGAGAIFGGYQLVEDRKRKLQARRQAARTQLRQFTDDVQFEVGNDLTGLLRDVHRDLRDEFVALIGELQQSWVDAARHAQEAADAGEQAMSRRRHEADDHRRRLTAIRGSITEVDG